MIFHGAYKPTYNWSIYIFCLFNASNIWLLLWFMFNITLMLIYVQYMIYGMMVCVMIQWSIIHDEYIVAISQLQIG